MNIIVYPKGFLGYDVGINVNTSQATLDEVIQAIKHNKNVPSMKSIVSNRDVDIIWSQYTGAFQYMSSFDFREKIILIALKAFGTQNFMSWIKLQEMSPMYTDMHRRFIMDTLRFIHEGSRSVNIQSWIQLIYPRETTQKDREFNVPIEDIFDTSIDNQLAIGSKLPQSLVEIIPMWCAQPGGIEDMLTTMRVLFGDNQPT